MRVRVAKYPPNHYKKIEQKMSNTTNQPVPKAGIMGLVPYAPGKVPDPSLGKTFKLSANESPLGPSPKALEAFHDTASDLFSYPDPSARSLRTAIARKYGLNPDHLVCGNGSDELLNLVARIYLGPGDEAIYTQYGFTVYPIAIQANGATPVVAPDHNFTVSVDEILARVTERTKVVFLANPNNPTGTYIPQSEVRRLSDGLPKGCVLVLDGAYAEFVRMNDYEAGIELVSTTQNTIMTRTFSKIYGLAAIRLGWAYASENIIEAIARVRDPFNVTGPSLAAAVAAFEDTAHTEKVRQHNDIWLPKLRQALIDAGLEVTPSLCNFLLLHFPDVEGKRAHDAHKFLAQQGLMLRQMDEYNLPNALRLSIGTAEANELVIAALTKFMQGGA